MVEKETYLASDGKEFERKKDCIMHQASLELEEKLKKRDNPIIKIDDIEILQLVESYLDAVIPNFFQDRHEMFAISIQNEEDIQIAKLFCQKYEGEENGNWKNTFIPGNKYLIYIANSSTRMYGTEYSIYVLPYDNFLHYYEIMLDKIKNIF